MDELSQFLRQFADLGGAEVGGIDFADPPGALSRLRGLVSANEERVGFTRCLPILISGLMQTADPDRTLVNFDRFVNAVDDRDGLFEFLGDHPRAVEILIKISIGSQFLTEILIRNPSYLNQLTERRQLAEFKSREDFVGEGAAEVDREEDTDAKLDALRRYQRWEHLRIGACDTFRLMDLRTVTIQLSLLADSLVRNVLRVHADRLGIETDGFAVLAFGKLGGEELNYSSDIDLVFLSRDEAPRFWPLGQRLIQSLISATGEGFLYRTDMRLRPWGRSGPLVTSVDGYLEYLEQHAELWEKQALVKARVVAGDESVGKQFLERVEPYIYGNAAADVRENIRDMKHRIEDELEKAGRKFQEVKSGHGSIRDIEFTVQYLQLINGRDNPSLHTVTTLDALVRLADFGFIRADEYRQLTGGYVFLRSIEHALQLMHYKQTHLLPENERELRDLSRRLDFLNSDQFLTHYRQHCESIRNIYLRYIEGRSSEETEASPSIPRTEEIVRMEPSYHKTFSEEEVGRHAELLARLTESDFVAVAAEPRDNGRWSVTIVGLDEIGDLSLICGLLFVYGFDIEDGNAFLVDPKSGRPSSLRRRVRRSARETRKFVNVFRVRPPLETVLPEVWTRYRDELARLMELAASGRRAEAQGKLARKLAHALRPQVATDQQNPGLFAVDIEIDNEISPHATVLRIRSEDTTGFLYELSNGLSLSGIDVIRMIARSEGHRVFDTLYVTDEEGHKITNPDRQQRLRAAIVLIKHFTHLLPTSADPEAALLHFRDFLEQLLQMSNWSEQLGSIERPDILEALARLLGVSDFLWEDFLRLQHDNLFPVIRDIEGLRQPHTRETLASTLADALSESPQRDRLTVINEFKDREMFRADMRHILGYVEEFGDFSRELTDLVEVVIAATLEQCGNVLRERFGDPRRPDGAPCRLAVVALGKCGGRELGFASDIELMFVHEEPGTTDGSRQIGTSEYFEKLAEQTSKSIKARSEGIFQVDLRLRPYGRSGNLAVTETAFRDYFAPDGPAWPYERQALVKLRAIAGDADFGALIEDVRDDSIYMGNAFDLTSMRAMREKQITQLVRADTINAKLSPGGLVDCEYFVQGLQLRFGGQFPELRATNTRQAMKALRDAGILGNAQYQRLHDAYVFHRRLIDALRMVRGNAQDLTVPSPASEEHDYLARRLGYGMATSELTDDLERHTSLVLEMTRRLDNLTKVTRG